jgi:hypothetical protein
MRSIIIVLALTSSAAASDNYAVVGLGTSVANNTPGWMLRVEQRVDTADSSGDGKVFGGRVGLELWQSGAHTGFSVPMGYYVGGQAGGARAILGGGLGMWAFTFHDGESDGGFAPFSSSTVDLRLGKLLISFDARISRQLGGDEDDFNVYSFMLMVGK